MWTVFFVVDGGKWFIDVKNRPSDVGEGLQDDPTATLTMASSDFLQIFNGKLSMATAIKSGRLRVDGDIKAAMKLENVAKKLIMSKL